MPTLANINGRSLVPNVGPALGTLEGAFGSKQQRDEKARLLKLEEEKRKRIAAAIAAFTVKPAVDPDVAEGIRVAEGDFTENPAGSGLAASEEASRFQTTGLGGIGDANNVFQTLPMPAGPPAGPDAFQTLPMPAGPPAGPDVFQLLSGGVDEGEPTSRAAQEQAAASVSNIDGTAGQALAKVAKEGTETDKAEFRAEAVKASATLTKILSNPDPAVRQRELLAEFNRRKTSGEDTSQIAGMLNMSPEKQEIALKKKKMVAEKIAQALPAPAPSVPGSIFDTPQKIAAFAQLAVDAPQAAGVLQRLNASRIAAARTRGEKGFTLKPGETRFGPGGKRIASVPGGSGKGFAASAKTEIFRNGAAIQALPNGQVDVKGPDGKSVTGAARLQVLRDAQKAELDFARTKSGETTAGSAAIKRSEKVVDRLGKIKVSVANIDRAIELLDKGAQTGPIRSFLPSIRASSVALDNVQKAMGLDVIGTTTFGALSKGELDLALSKALPTKLRPDALREWLVDKKAAQEKLAGYLENAAIFLGTPGATTAQWIEQQKSLRKEQIQSPNPVAVNKTATGASAASDLTAQSIEKMTKDQLLKLDLSTVPPSLRSAVNDAFTANGL